MTNQLIEFLTLEQVNKLLKAEKRKEYRLAIILGFGSGLRLSEIVGYERDDGTSIEGLSKENVDLKNHQIKIIGGKGKKDRITVTSPLLNESFVKLLPLKMARRTLQYNFSKLCFKVLGIKGKFHHLRHGFGNYMAVVRNIPLPMVKDMLGHSRLDTTGIYTKSNPIHTINTAWEAFN